MTVRIYKEAERIPRATLRVLRYSVEKSNIIPSGAILPWYGSVDRIPSGFALCDGQNGTPDLRKRFLVGADDESYKLGNKGGEEKHVLTINEMPAHNHDAASAVGYFRSRSNTFYKKATPSNTLGLEAASGCFSVVESGLRSEGNADDNSTEYIVKFDGSKIVSMQGSDQAHENRPPYFAVYYIMKL